MNRYHVLLILSISVVIGSVSFYFYSELNKDIVTIHPVEENQNTFVEQTNPAFTITEINKLENKKFSWLRTELTGKTNLVSKSPLSFILNFNKDLKFSSSTDCNNNSGIYKFSGSNLSFSEIIATRMFCENSQENDYIEQLSNVESFEISGDALYLNLAGKKGRMVFSSKGL